MTMTARADRDFSGIQVTAADWPMVLIAFPANQVPDAAIRSLLGHIESLMTEAARNREKIFIITDISLVREMSPTSQRQHASEWIKRTSALARATSVGSASVTPSALLRLIFTTVFWLQPSPTPYFFVPTRREAVLKGIQLLEAERVRLPQRLLAYRDDSAAAERIGRVG
jgi:hypothetical protein